MDSAAMVPLRASILHDPDLHRLAPVARWFWLLRGVLPTVVVALVATIALTHFHFAGWAYGLDTAAFVGLVWWWRATGRRYRAWGYVERQRDLVVTHGVLFQRLSVVPYGRMQFVDVYQGPIDRMFGVATVKLHTAAAATDAEIPFVSNGEATRLRERLTELGESHSAGL